MYAINVQEEILEEVEVSGHLALFTELRVDESTVPEGIFCYALRHGDDDSFPVALEKEVVVNYFGSVLMTKELELDKEQCLSVGYDNFWYTGAEMKLADFLAKLQKNIEPEHFQNGKALATFLETVFPITDKEGEKLFGYLEGQQQLLGQKAGELFRCRQNNEGEEMYWEPCSIEDVITDVCEYNYNEILQVTQELMDAGTIKECAKLSDRLNSLCEDEKLLDALFDRTKEGKEIEKLAQILADELIKNAQSKEGLDRTLQKMTEAMGEGKDRTPEFPSEVRKSSGRSR